MNAIVRGGTVVWEAVPEPQKKKVRAKVIEWLKAAGLYAAVDMSLDNIGPLVESVSASLFGSGVDPTKQNPGTDDKRKIMLVELARSGIEFAGTEIGLSAQEMAAFTKMALEFKASQSARVDSKQASADRTEEQHMLYLAQMSRVCSRLGLTGHNRFRQLYDISLVLNTIREGDVERAEKHESVFGQIKV